MDLEAVFKSPQARESSINFLRGWEAARNDDVDGWMIKFIEILQEVEGILIIVCEGGDKGE